MHTLYLVSVWLHILAATAWIGGMFFLVLVVVPWLRTGDPVQAGEFLRATGERFRTVGWTCFGILLVTGLVILWARGVRVADFARPEWLSSRFGSLVALKLGLFAAVLAVSARHDFVVGPRASAAMRHAPTGPAAERLRRHASRLGRLNALLALGLVAAGVMLVRGTPW